ncbi:MAG: helix-turn-helix transcriptional regulator [Acidobacteria bacterium]|nr:helix-turn-helix transcriptional regulator [Acidobacteriota bacterium]
MEKQIVKTVSAIYEAAQSPTSRPLLDVCDKIGGMVNAQTDGLTVINTKTADLTLVESKMEPELLRIYAEEFQHINLIQKHIAGLGPGGRLNRVDFIGDAEFGRSDIYNEFFQKAGIYNFEYRVIATPGDYQAAIEFSRPKGRDNFSTADQDLIDVFVPHLGRAFSIHFNYLPARSHAGVLTEVLDRIPRGVLVVDEARKVLFSNSSGSSILTEGDGIFINRRGGLSARNNADHKRFKAAIAGVFASPGINSGWAATIRLNRGNGKRPLELLIAKCTKGDCDQFGTGEKAIIFVSDPESKRVSVADVLCELYGLTRSEARVASLIVDGMSPAEVSNELCVSENTVKTHLKRIFSKTDTKRQTELAKLVLLGPASLKFDDETNNRKNTPYG